MLIYIKNMVCIRCKMAVESVLQGLGIEYQSVELGRVNLVAPLSTEQQIKLSESLNYYHLELMDDRKKILVEKVKTLIRELFSTAHMPTKLKLSHYLSEALHYDYTYLTNIFSDMEDSTIERFYIVTRVEKVKEMIVYERVNITEISYELNYSSVSHLCLQFKKVTGQTPTEFRKLCESPEFIWRNC